MKNGIEITIDRIEGKFALVETQNDGIIAIPIKALPEGICEGCVIDISINHKKTNNRKSEVENLIDDIFEK